MSIYLLGSNWFHHNGRVIVDLNQRQREEDINVTSSLVRVYRELPRSRRKYGKSHFTYASRTRERVVYTPAKEAALLPIKFSRVIHMFAFAPIYVCSTELFCVYLTGVNRCNNCYRHTEYSIKRYSSARLRFASIFTSSTIRRICFDLI